mmetsp:Transcript_41039/g.49326  ORF Transcript_41039/g.49326 Transcript_41039/m.49326 type:complete len:282 (+) Transcript_41039:382-1227(+)
MDAHNANPIGGVRVGKFNLPIDPSRPQERRVEDIDPIGCHDHLDVLRRFESIELVEKFQHGPLHFRITPGPSTIPPAGTDGVDLVHKNDGGSRLSRHDEQFSYHPATLSDILLHQFRAAHSDEGAIGMVRHGACQQRFPRPGWAVQEHTLGLRHPQRIEQLGVLNRQFNHLLNLHHLLLQPPDHIVRAIRHRFHFHQTHQRIHFRRQDFVERVAIVPEGYSRVRFQEIDIDPLIEIDHVFAFGVDLHQHFFETHLFHDFSDVRARFLEMVEFFAEHSDTGV